MKLISVYCLVHPVTENVFYVGATNNPKARLKAHIKSPSTETGRIILANGLVPIMKIVAECDLSESKNLEEIWIKNYITQGHKVENKYFKSNQGKRGGRPKKHGNFINRTVWIEESLWEEMKDHPSHSSVNSFICEAIKEKIGKPNLAEEQIKQIKNIVNQSNG